MFKKSALILIVILAVTSFAGGAWAYWGLVGCSTSDSASIFSWDWQTGEFVFQPAFSLLEYGNYPYDAVMRPGGDEIWVVGASGDGVVVVGPDGTILHEIPTGEYPVSLSFNPRQDIALVSCRDSDRMDIIDTNTYLVTGSLEMPWPNVSPGNLIFDPIGDRFFMVEWYGDMVFEIDADGSSILDHASVGNSLWQLAIDPNFGGYLFLTDRGSDQVRAIDPETLQQVQAIDVGDDPWGIDVDESMVVVTCEDSHDFYIIDGYSFSVMQVDLAPDADPRDVNIETGFVTVGDKTLLGGAAYICGGITSEGSLLYVVDLYSGEFLDVVVVPGTNTNVVAVEPQWFLSSPVEDLPAADGFVVQAAPNPFNPRTTISFALDQEAAVRLAIFDLAGRMVRFVDGGTRGPGIQNMEWDGKDRSGRSLASGNYLVVVQAGEAFSRTKVTLVQ